MGLFKKRCKYCGEKIEKGKESYRDVKVPGFVGKCEGGFCNEGHADKYEKEIEKRKCGSCC